MTEDVTKIDNARAWLGGAFHREYRDYIESVLAGDFACALVELFEAKDSLIQQLAANAATDANLSAMRREGLSIDGDNAYKRDLLDAVVGALAFGKQRGTQPPAGHWAERFYEIGMAEADERDALAAENLRLRDLLAQKLVDSTMLTGLVPDASGINLGFEGGACGLLADAFGEQLANSGAENYIEASFVSQKHPELGRLVVTLKREIGKSPHELRQEAEQKREQFRALSQANAEALGAALREIAGYRQVLDNIGGLTRALRHGGPDPMDLQGLSDALEEAVSLANDALEATPAPEVPEEQGSQQDAVAFRCKLSTHKDWKYIDHRAPDSFELRELEIQQLYTKPQPPMNVAPLVGALEKIKFRADCFAQEERDMQPASCEVISDIAGRAIEAYRVAQGGAA